MALRILARRMFLHSSVFQLGDVRPPLCSPFALSVVPEHSLSRLSGVPALLLNGFCDPFKPPPSHEVPSFNESNCSHKNSVSGISLSNRAKLQGIHVCYGRSSNNVRHRSFVGDLSKDADDPARECLVTWSPPFFFFLNIARSSRIPETLNMFIEH